MQAPVATIICITSVLLPSLVPKSCHTASRSIPLLMDQSIEVDDQEPVPNDGEPPDEDVPTTSSELEQHSESEESK